MKHLAAPTPRARALALGALALAAVALVVLLLVASSATPGRQGPDVTAPGAAVPGSGPPATGSAAPEPSPVPIASAPTVVAQPPPPEPPASAAIAVPVAPAATRAPATPTPSPDPNVWRVEGVLIDETTKLPIREVCVVIGPHGCQRGSVRTDGRGVFYFDVPQVPTVFYDLYFVKDGYWTVWLRIKPEGPSVYNLALTPR